MEEECSRPLPFGEDFLASLRVERRLADNTVKSYGRDLMLYGTFLRDRGIESPTESGHADLQAYLQWLSQRGLSARSRARNLSALRAFYRFLKLEGNHREGSHRVDRISSGLAQAPPAPFG